MQTKIFICLYSICLLAISSAIAEEELIVPLAVKKARISHTSYAIPWKKIHGKLNKDLTIDSYDLGERSFKSSVSLNLSSLIKRDNVINFTLNPPAYMKVNLFQLYPAKGIGPKQKVYSETLNLGYNSMEVGCFNIISQELKQVKRSVHLVTHFHVKLPDYHNSLQIYLKKNFTNPEQSHAEVKKLLDSCRSLHENKFKLSLINKDSEFFATIIE